MSRAFALAALLWCLQARAEQPYMVLQRQQFEAANAERRAGEERQRKAEAEQNAVEEKMRLHWEKKEAEHRQKEAEAEAQRAAARQVDADRVARVEAMGADPKYLRIVYSAAVCWYQEERKTAYELIAKEKKYARIGGMVDKKALYDWQQDIRQADEKIPPILALLRGIKAKPLPCTEPTVKGVAWCIGPVLGGQDGEGCDEGGAPDYIALANKLL